MAFVFRSNQASFSKRPITPSPTTYQNLSLAPKSNNIATTFNDRTNRELWKNDQNPGPGQYSTSHIGNPQPNQILFQSPQFTLVNDASSKNKACCSSFKSKSKRLENKRPQTPGPGYYQTFPVKGTRTGKTNKMKKPTQLTRYLFSQASKQGFTTYNDKDVSQYIFHCEQRAQSAAFIRQKKQKQSNIFASRVQRSSLVRPVTAVGPGSYNIQESYAALNKKTTKINKQNLKLQIKSKEIPDFLKQSIQMLPEEVGPGKYQVKTNFQSKNPSWSQGISCFGSLQSRFERTKQNKIKIEKQNYQDTFLINQLKDKKKGQKTNQYKKVVPFMSNSVKQKSFLTDKSSKNIYPGLYNIGKNMYEDLVKKNIKKDNTNAKVIFGSGINRFSNPKEKGSFFDGNTKQQCYKDLKIETEKDKGNNHNLGMQSRITKVNQTNEKMKKNKKDDWSKASTKQKKLLGSKDNRPLCYDTQSKTFNEKFQTKKQQQAPFLALSQRFKSSNSNLQTKLWSQFEQKEKQNIEIKSAKYKADHKQKIKKFIKQTNKQDQSKNVQSNKCSRVIGQTKQNYQNIGPASYNPVSVKKNISYNVLFRSVPASNN